MSARHPDQGSGLFEDGGLRAPAGNAARFGARWRLVGAGLSNVWRYGDLELPAPSGRLLLRGPNGTGKTTALESLWPYLLDLNAARLGAGKTRSTTLIQLMREGAGGQGRCGYTWLTAVGPGDEGEWSFGVRLQYSASTSPAVRVAPFATPGRPLRDLALFGPGRSTLRIEDFTAAVQTLGGQVFDEPETYVAHVSARLWQTDAGEAPLLAARLREVRNPTLLGELTARAAADALRESLPGVPGEVVEATAEALAESETTRDAFARDRDNADVLASFLQVWTGHVVEVTSAAHQAAVEAVEGERRSRVDVRRLTREYDGAVERRQASESRAESLKTEASDIAGRIDALEKSDAYRSAGMLDQLKVMLTSQRREAAAAGATLVTAARAVAQQVSTLRQTAEDLAGELVEAAEAATGADPAAAAHTQFLTWETAPGSRIEVGDVVADPGPDIRVLADPDAVGAAAAGWIRVAGTLTERADAASLAITEHGVVARAGVLADGGERRAVESAEQADAAKVDADLASAAAVTAAAELLSAVADWTPANRDLAASEPGEPGPRRTEPADEPTGWSTDDVDELRSADPAAILSRAQTWADHARNRAAAVAAALNARAAAAVSEADRLAADAAGQRAEAAALRAGRLLPLPRPDWAGPGDDAVAFGAALEWGDSLTDARGRDLLETALAASGLLGATLGSDGVSSGRWRLDAGGPEQRPSLADVLGADPQHPLAELATAALHRVALAGTAPDADLAHEPDDTPESAPSASGGAAAAVTRGRQALVIGLDGTFRTGVLVGAAPGSRDDAELPAAQFVGSRQRRAAALARAAELDAEAVSLEFEATGLRVEGRQLREQARAVTSRAATFPSAELLRSREASRAVAAGAARRARTRADEERSRATELRAEHRRLSDEWSARTRDLGLPPDPAQLGPLRAAWAASAKLLREQAGRLGGRLLKNLRRLLGDLDRLDADRAALVELTSRARRSHDSSAESAARVATIEATAGASIRETLARLGAARDRAAALVTDIETAGLALNTVNADLGRLGAELHNARASLAAAEPRAAGSRRKVRELLLLPGVGPALLDRAEPADDAGLLAQVEQALSGRQTSARRTLHERYDQARARLAGTWTLDPGDIVGNLETYVLTHRDATYEPGAAARHAGALADSARAALAAAEEAALRDFVIGRLPAAISAAWVQLHDWVRDVNRKMRSAAASSGVGVQVRMALGDLSPAARTTYELSCLRSEATRTDAERDDLGRALQMLIGASDGETMHERIAAAVDIRTWVDLHYEVTRPGSEKAERWGQRTGLSGGERRLVVLAPMLAAIAAAYDRLGPTSLRLAALDEVPAEVDERGREGLARYLAELDLDLVCTSYLWDGAPGAWDGIDAHDLEGAPDGTVVAFPMLVRGDEPLPGEPAW